jgi:hypothetical protein
MTSGQLKALESAFGGGQYNLDIAGMAQAAATARETSYSPAGVAYSQFGINANQPGNKAIVQLLNRIRRGVRAGEFTPGEAMNLYGAGNAGLSEAGIRSFANLSDDEARKQSHEALDTKKFDIPKDQERAWSEFYRYLSDFGTKIEAIVGRHLTPILKVLEENGEKFLHSLEQFLAGDDFKQFLEKVPGYITRIADTLGGLARMLEKALHMLGFIETADEKKAREAFQQQQGKTLNDLSGQTGWTPLERLMGGKYDPGKGFKETWDMLTGAAGGAWDWYGKTAPPFSRDMGSGVLGSHQGGTDYVKQSGLYNLHQGEVVTSAAEVERLRQESNKYSIEDALRVMTGHESGNQYGIMGPNVKGDRPYGRYQIMGANIPSWTREILGYSMSPEQFLRNPGAQDAVGRAKFASYVAKYGSIADAMSAWASGQPLAKGADTHDVVFKHSTADYVRARLAELSGGHFGGGGGGFRLDVNDNTGGNVNLVASQMGLQPLPAFPL